MKYKIKINNKIKAFGQTDTKTGLIEINKKKHKGDKKQLADTIKHEIFHVKHPKATEKTVYKKTGSLTKMTEAEKNKYLSKIRMKKLNYKGGAIKRKLKMKASEKTEAGSLIRKANESKLSKQNLAIRGLV